MAGFRKIIIETHYTKNKTQQKVCFRSNWEINFASFLDSNTNVKEWRNDFPIKYKDRYGSQKIKTYFIDFQVFMNDGTTLLCEVKPIKTLELRVNTKSMRYKRIHTSNLLKNYSKFETVELFCKKIGWRFFLIEKQDHHFQFFKWDIQAKKPILIR
jgi:hypothetical protein